MLYSRTSHSAGMQLIGTIKLHLKYRQHIIEGPLIVMCIIRLPSIANISYYVWYYLGDLASQTTQRIKIESTLQHYCLGALGVLKKT